MLLPLLLIRYDKKIEFSGGMQVKFQVNGFPERETFS